LNSKSLDQEAHSPNPSSEDGGGGAWKRRLRRCAIGLALLFAVLMIANAVYSWRIGQQLDQQLAKLRAAGEPTSFAELAPKPIPPEQDAAVHLQRLTSQLKAFAKEHVDFLYQSPLGKSFREQRKKGQPPTREQIDAIRDILSHYVNLPQALDTASRCKGYTSQIDYTVADTQVLTELTASVGGIRTAIRFLRWKITVMLAEGKQEEAVKTGLVTLRLARHFDDEPAMINGLAAIAVRGVAVDSLNLVLRSGPIFEELRKELDQELTLHDDSKWIAHVMKTERAINVNVSKSMFAQAWWMPWMAKGLQIDMIDYHERLLPVITQPWYLSHKQIPRVHATASHSTYISGTLFEMITPAIEVAHDAFNRNTAQLRCLRIVNALTAYAQEHGREAEGLDDLDLPDGATLDPFSGKPLKLKWTEEGWVVYTVFKNGTDDSGDFKDQADWGLGPAGYPGAK